MTDEPTTLDDVFGVLLYILDELREANNKARISPDAFCHSCGSAIETDEHPTGTHTPPRLLS